MGSGIEKETVEMIEWPGLLTCAADREDHGTTGAYTAWPALAAEALCYIEGNCSCVDIASLVCCVAVIYILARLPRASDPSWLQILGTHVTCIAVAIHVHFAIQERIRGTGQLCTQHISRSLRASERRAPTKVSSLPAVQR
jgi:hypothetical protein